MRKRRRGSIVALVALGVSLAATTQFVTASPASNVPAGAPDGKVVRSGEPTGPGVLESVEEVLPETGQRYQVTKRRLATGQVVLEGTDQAGRPVDVAGARAAEARALEGKGRVDRALQSALVGTPADQRLPVAVWVAAGEPPNDRSVPLEQHLADLEAFYAQARDRTLAAVRRHDPTAEAAQYSPVVFAQLTPGQVRALSVQRDTAIEVMYRANEARTNFDAQARTGEGSTVVWNNGVGNLGFGTSSRPVVHEPDGVSSADINNASHPVIYYCSAVSTACPLGKNADNHSTSVGSVIAGNNGQATGIAPKAQIVLSANTQDFTDAKLVAAFEWARGNGGDPTNMSWGTTCPDGTQNFMSRYLDYAVRTLWATLTVASGNTRGCATRDLEVSNPGTAWSVITVGSYNDVNTPFWNDDVMSGFSDYLNPGFAPGMEKPEVVAVGENVLMNTTAGIANNNGTSFAAPAVAGQVTSMLARQPGQNIWPETNKAAVLTSAYHDITGGLADKSRDGVGGILTNVSDDTYRLGRFSNGFYATTDTVQTRTINLTAGQVTRVAGVWTSWSTGGAGTDQLGADLDLCVVRNDTNATVACSSSVSNAWELVEFTAPVTGAYTVRLSKFSAVANWPGSYFGIAWSTRATPAPCTSGVSVLPATGATVNGVSTTYGTAWWSNYAGYAVDQSGRERIFRVTTNAVKDLRFSDLSLNPNLDVHIVGMPSCGIGATTITRLASGADTAFLDNAPAGTYYLIVDGRNGVNGTTNVSLTVTGP